MDSYYITLELMILSGLHYCTQFGGGMETVFRIVYVGVESSDILNDEL